MINSDKLLYIIDFNNYDYTTSIKSISVIYKIILNILLIFKVIILYK